MDQAATVIQNNLWIELLKLAIFAVFATSLIEVVKGVSARGILITIKEIIMSVWKNDALCKESIAIINFSIALLLCYAFDYGVIDKVIQPGEKIRQGLAGWLDYLGTASLIYNGADTLFKRFASMRDSWESSSKTETKLSSETKTTTLTEKSEQK